MGVSQHSFGSPYSTHKCLNIFFLSWEELTRCGEATIHSSSKDGVWNDTIWQCFLVLLLGFGTCPLYTFDRLCGQVTWLRRALPPLSHLGIIEVWKLDLWAEARNSLLQGYVTSELCTKEHSKAGEARGGRMWTRYLLMTSYVLLVNLYRIQNLWCRCSGRVGRSINDPSTGLCFSAQVPKFSHFLAFSGPWDEHHVCLTHCLPRRACLSPLPTHFSVHSNSSHHQALPSFISTVGIPPLMIFLQFW